MTHFIDDELNSHLEDLADDLVSEGLPATAARTEAERRFGDVTATRAELLALHPVKRWPVLGLAVSGYFLYGALLFDMSTLVPARGLLGLALERLLVAWWSWLVLGAILLMNWWLMQFYGVQRKWIVPAVVALTLLCGLSITAVLDIDNFEVNLHALAAGIVFTLLLLAVWSKLSVRLRLGLLMSFAFVMSLAAIQQKLLFAFLWPARCLYLTPATAPLTGALAQCEQLVWWNPMLWPLYGLLGLGMVWLSLHLWRLWRNRGTYWYRKILTTTALSALPLLPIHKNNLNNAGGLDVIPWKQQIYSAYWDILGRAPEDKDFAFYADTRAYEHMSRIRAVLHHSYERRLKITLVFQHILKRAPTTEELESYAQSYLSIDEIRAELKKLKNTTE